MIKPVIMDMKVGGTGVLPLTELTQLGRINIICGRNASGKSTLLQAIHAGNRIIGLDLTAEKFEHLRNLCGRGIDLGRGREQPFERLVLRAVETQPRGVWYSDQARAFRKTFDTEYGESEFHVVPRRNADVMENEFPSLFPKTFPQSVLLPAKRELQMGAQLTVSGAADARGSNVLNKLLYAQTQLPGSAERAFLQQLEVAFQKISGGWQFAANTAEQNNIGLYFSRDDGATWVVAGACGQGLHELLLILFFALRPEYELLCIEEPENHMHPDMQRRLLAFFHDETTKQFFIATHSNVFLNAALTDKVLFTTFDGAIRVDDATSRAMVLSDLGYSVTDNLVSDLVILVEGPTDMPVLQEFLRKWGLLSRFDIKMWPLNGDTMAQTDLSVFAGRYNLLGVIDQDPGSGRARHRFVETCKRLEIPVYQLERYSIENYFSLEAIRTVFGGQISKEIERLDPKRKLEDQLNLDPKKSNRRLAELTSRVELDASDIPRLMEKIEHLAHR